MKINTIIVHQKAHVGKKKGKKMKKSKEKIWKEHYKYLKEEINNGNIKKDNRIGFLRLSEDEVQFVRYDFLPMFIWETLPDEWNRWCEMLTDIPEDLIPKTLEQSDEKV